MTRRHGYGLFAAMITLVVAVSTAIYVGATLDDGTTPQAKTVSRARGDSGNAVAPASAGTWVGTWSASPVGGEPGTAVQGLAGRSLRNVVHTSAGGTSARATLSNLYGTQPLTIAHASIAVAAAANSASADAGTMRRLTFGGSPSVTIPAGQQIVSDAVRIVVPRDSDVLVTTYSAIPSGPVTYHPHARQISYAALGDRTEDPYAAAYTEQVEAWRYVTALDVFSNEADGTVVFLGDSLTAGTTSSVGTNSRWPDVLSDRLHAAAETGADVPHYSVLNQGIGGNRVLKPGGLSIPAPNASGLERFGRDVLDHPNVKVVVIDLGVNDILRSRNPKALKASSIVAGLRQMVAEAHGRGLRVVGATLMPFGGFHGYSATTEGLRQAVNAEIRAGRVYDAYVDFDKAMRDPRDPRRFLPGFNSGDHLHPSDAGYARMAEVFDLEELKGAAPARL
ncbi:SGNH/GDSL hydrolase family protein [Streptomyces sp. ME02-8801-2C]|uniref:SGNH/GDSL hydrolase family protein n=1 Tax=Streptomyces sp. ME02-8801-2C TaxID=3028680 RepID=UPI0029B4340D|nr:SGNH/GDSL hydrolase family protein [Streptomyces sp. ME02-8801-2C]MDX3454486.1 SGNH/GDSL hydrolase family protein [Streptomyces sp. ME02-8801-2C]